MNVPGGIELNITRDGMVAICEACYDAGVALGLAGHQDDIFDEAPAKIVLYDPKENSLEIMDLGKHPANCLILCCGKQGDQGGVSYTLEGLDVTVSICPAISKQSYRIKDRPTDHHRLMRDAFSAGYRQAMYAFFQSQGSEQ